MVSITPYIDHVNITGRPMLWLVYSDNYILTNGQQAVQLIKFGSTPSDGETLIITFNGQSYVWIFKTSPVFNGQELPLSVSAGALIPYFQSNVTFYNAFQMVLYLYDTITFTANSNGSAYNMTIGGTYSTAALTGLSTGIDRAVRDKYKFKAIVSIVNSNLSYDFITRAVLEAYPDNNAVSAFDVSKIINPYLDSYLPEYGSPYVVWCPNSMKCYRIGAYAEYGTPITQEGITWTSSVLAFKSRMNLDRIEFSASTGYFNVLSSRCLTFQPLTKSITIDQPEYLYVISEPDIISISVSATFDDNSGSSWSIIADMSSPNIQVGVYCIPVGFNDMDIHSHLPAGAKCVQYQVTITTTFGTLETRIFKMVDSCNKNTQYFLYENSLGAFETLRTTALYTNAIKVQQNTYTRPFVVGMSEVPSEFFQSQTTGLKKYRSGTGYHPKEWEDHWADEFISSEKRYLIDMENGRYIPIVLDTNSIEVGYNRQTKPYSFRFDYSLAFTTAMKSGTQYID